MSIESFVEVVRECGHPNAPEVVDRLTKPSETFGEGEQFAIVSAVNVTIKEGTSAVNVPITISAENKDQTVEGIVLTVAVENPRTNMSEGPIAADRNAFVGSLWREHPNLVDDIRQVEAGTRVLLIPFSPPFGSITADGLVCNLTVDTSQLKAGQTYRINTNSKGGSSAVAIVNPDPNSLHYAPVVIRHHGGTINVVA